MTAPATVKDNQMITPTVESAIVVDAADRLATAASTRRPCPPVIDLIEPDDVDTAYRVQTHNVTAAVDAGRRIVGRKIGLTSPAVQRQLGVDQPDLGVLFADMDCSNDSHVEHTRLLQPRIEAEIAFVLARDITAPITADTAPDYVDQVVAAFEIVDSRIEAWNISLADTVADNASSGLYVLGDSIPRTDAPDLATIDMTMTENGIAVSRGVGSDCLGSPWHALAWLANTSLTFGSPLRAGHVVLSGALGPMVPVLRGATYTATITGVGDVRASFTA
ncbi:fumarylacetoacetate hydrolase family protein [Antrihabitans sp. YC3-6]|uniref:Fumarylacetoacetate hydrolase family protein n=2 Tax=Antrihabitans stalagmiti TaxID=2799499 RepID=A0A934U399_9NOCA|nr:fumarylacetoacetate hydrolase family protein [Antrihabitans stalagmiti]